MRLGRRYGLSAAQKTEIWRRWKAGESLHEIGRALGKNHGSIAFLHIVLSTLSVLEGGIHRFLAA
jgi:hypothetical protein